MTEIYLERTGSYVFDVTRAYGLGLLVKSLLGEARIRNTDYGFIISEEGGEGGQNELEALLGADICNWRDPLLSAQKEAESKWNETVKFLVENGSDIIKHYEDGTIGSYSREIGDEATLYGTMDPTAVKGIRAGTLSEKYSEGHGVKVSKVDFSLCLLGHSVFSTWQSSRGVKLCIIPEPEETFVGDYLRIRTSILSTLAKGGQEKSGQITHFEPVSRAGEEVSVAKHACRLMLEINSQAMRSKNAMFRRLLYYTLFKTTQWKPGNISSFPLDFLRNIKTELGGEANDLYRTWSELLAMGKSSGHEDMAIALAKALKMSDLLNWTAFASRQVRNKDSRNMMYESRQMEAVFKCLKV